MITEHDLKEAIAEYEGIRNPSPTTCVKLASFYYLLERKEKVNNGYSYQSQSAEKPIEYKSDTEFAELVQAKGIDVLPLFDELMTVLKSMAPKLYESVITKIKAEV